MDNSSVYPGSWFGAMRERMEQVARIARLLVEEGMAL